MQSKPLGLGIVVAFGVLTLAACETPTSAPTLVVPASPSFARGGKPASAQSTAAGISMTPSTVLLSVGSDAWLHVTVYDRNGNATPDNDGRLLWFGCAPTTIGVGCSGLLDMIPIYPNLRDIHLIGRVAGTYKVWVDDGAGHTATTNVTVQ